MVANLEWASCLLAENCHLNCPQARRKQEALASNGLCVTVVGQSPGNLTTSIVE